MSVLSPEHLKRATAILAMAFVLATSVAARVTEQVILSFTGQNGVMPNSRLIADSAGRLYGTTLYGGTPGPSCIVNTGCGVVFALAPKAGGGWNYRRLHAFTGGGDGGVPGSSLVFDAAGNLYGVATGGGAHDGGVVFKLSPSASGPWTETVIYSFDPANSADAVSPTDGLTFDATGNLYGNAGGGPKASGTVFRLTPNSDGSWSESVLYDFTAANDGADVAGGVVFDGAGNLFGTTLYGGPSNLGNVFELSPTASGPWTENILYSFGGCCPNNPSGPLWLDPTGNIYGTGPNPGDGYIFELVKGSGGSWTENLAYSFDLPTGGEPMGGLIADAKGNLYGTTAEGGQQFGNGNGVVFKLIPHSNGSWSESVVYAFAGGTDAMEPTAGVTLVRGALYGTTLYGGSANKGAVFKLAP